MPGLYRAGHHGRSGPIHGWNQRVPPGITTTLFQGIVPPNGFMVEVHDVNTVCYVSDSITYTAGANIDGKPAGFRIFGPSDANHVEQPDSGLLNGAIGFTPEHTFVTPTGYKPIGTVTIWCPVSTETLINARAW